MIYKDTNEFSSSVPNIWRDIKVFNNFAYIVADVADHGVQVFDLSRLRTAEGEMFTEDNHYAGVGNCHNIVSNEETGYMYAVGCTYGEYENLCGGGLHAINVNDPLNPVYEGCFGGDGYVHDAECVIYHGPDVRYQGSEICLCYNEDTLTVVDATDKANMVMLSRTGYSTAMYTHQGWLTDDHRIALLDDELDEMDSDDKVTKTYIWNVDDLEAPVLENTYRAPVESLDHNMYINGNLVYQSNYQAGMRILSLDRENYMLQEVAYLDVYPASTEADWNGSWSVYPYFPSGNVPVTSSPFGLFTVLPDYVAIDQAISETKAPQWRARYREVLTMGDNCPALVDIEEM